MKRRVAADVSLEMASVLFFCAAAFSSLTLWSRDVRSFVALASAASVPAGASLLFALLAFLSPNLVAVGKLVFPLNVTLPIIHGALCLMIATLLRTSFGMEMPMGPLRTALLWQDARYVGIAVAAQILTLSIFIALRPAFFGKPSAER